MGLGLCLVRQSLQRAITQECLSSSGSGVRGGERYDTTGLLTGPNFPVVSGVLPSSLSLCFSVKWAFCSQKLAVLVHGLFKKGLLSLKKTRLLLYSYCKDAYLSHTPHPGLWELVICIFHYFQIFYRPIWKELLSHTVTLSILPAFRWRCTKQVTEKCSFFWESHPKRISRPCFVSRIRFAFFLACSHINKVDSGCSMRRLGAPAFANFPFLFWFWRPWQMLGQAHWIHSLWFRSS